VSIGKSKMEKIIPPTKNGTVICLEKNLNLLQGLFWW
jgi:hypothetical protein